MFLKLVFVGSEYRFYGLRSELQEEYCRPEPGFPPQLWRPFWNERQPQRLCLQTGWGRATVSLCAVINIRRTSFPESSSHFYEMNVLFMDIKMRWRNTEDAFYCCLVFVTHLSLFVSMTCWNMKTCILYNRVTCLAPY